jgi:hypothetical protein
MPNHVDFDLIIKGDSNSLREFQEFAKEKHEEEEYTVLLSANKFIPYPEEFKRLDDEAKVHRINNDYSFKDGFNSGGYEWCCENWGTKWGIYDAELRSQSLEKKKGKLQYRANSAWSPPIPVIKAMSKRFPSLSFTMKYFECGMAFCGEYIVCNDQVLKDETAPYNGSRGG